MAGDDNPRGGAGPGPAPPPSAHDAVDAARIRTAWTAVAAVVAAGLGAAFGVLYIARCPGCAQEPGIAMAGIAPTWAAASALAAARWAWTRSLAAAFAAAVLLAWLALHFVVPGLVIVYAPLATTIGTFGFATGFLLYWAGSAALLVGVVFAIERLVRQLT